MKTSHLFTAGLSVTLFFLASCKKEPLNQLTQAESRIYISSYDSAANFSSFKTYNIADSVAVIRDGSSSKQLTAVDQAYIDAVNKYMQQKGYTLVGKDQNPDIGININRIYNTTTGIIDYTSYLDYGSYWDPYYWGYAGYGYYVPYAYGVYQVSEGLLSIDMLDLKNAPTKGKIDLLWNGLIRGEGIFNAANADSGVQTLFSQSTYLHSAQ